MIVFTSAQILNVNSQTLNRKSQSPPTHNSYIWWGGGFSRGHYLDSGCTSDYQDLLSWSFCFFLSLEGKIYFLNT